MSAFPWSLPRLTARSLRRWAACCGLLLACAPSARPPAAAAGGTLSPNGEAGENGKPGPFRVVFSGPQGEVAGGAQLSLVFSRPLRALSVAGEEAAPPIRLEPAIEGSFRYVGTHALIFQPKAGHLPNATAVRVTVPAEHRALDGSTLGQAHVFEFSTPRPRIVSSTPGDGANGLGPSTSFELELNQLVSRQELAKQLVLRAAGGKSGRPLAYDLRWPDQKFPKRVVVVPRAPLPAATPIELVLSAATVGQEGPLSAGADQTLTFHTYDRLAVSEIECARSSPRSPCMPHSGVWLTLTNPVKMRDLKKSVKIEPALPISWDSWRDDDDETAYIDLNAPFAPGKAYTIRVLAGLTDVFGQKLPQDHSLRLEIGDFDPRVALGVEGEYFEPTARPAIPVASVNVGSYSLWTHPLELAQVERLFADPVGEESAVRSLLSGVRERKIQPSAARNQPHQETLPVADVLPAGRGPLLMAARYEARGGTEQIHRIVQVTDLAIIAKLSAHGRSVVWVTALSTGKPLGDAEVRLSGTGAAGSEKWIKTNADGLAELPADALAPVRKRPERALIVVRRGKDWAYRSVGEGFSPWRLDVPADPLGEPREYGMLFSERGLYRPGDSVEVKGILRREGGSGNELLSERDFVLELRSPNWEVLETRAVHTTSFGTFAAKLRVPASARLGNYRVTVRPPGDPEDRYGGGLASTSFELAEYRPNEFSASAASASPSYRHGDEARFSLSADYLYGAPMSGASFNYRLTRMETYFAVPGAEAFVTGNHAYDSAYPERAPSSGLIDSGDGKLDGKGTFERKLPLSLPGQRSPELISFDAEVVDLSRQAIGTSSSVVVHPADHYVGIEPPESYLLPTAQPVSLRALLLSPEGQHLTGRAIELTLYRRKYGVVRETSAGQSHTETRLIETRVGSCKVQSEREPRGCPLTPVDPGYYVVVAEARDAKGRSARAAVDFYALGSGGDSGFWPEDDSARLELVANKKQYAPGDVARVLVKSPFPSAEALITVEADGVKSERRVTLVGPTPSIEVPITDAMRPNAYVGVHLVRARSKPAPEGGQVDLGAPTFRTGYVDLPINPELRRLAVELRPNRTDYRPGEEITVDLAVKAGNQGVTSEVTVYAVDEGVLSLIGYRTPDPIPVFTAARPLRTTLLEAREDLARLSRDPRELLGLGPNKGAEGGGGGDEAGARRDFRQSAYFNPAVLTDGSGKATVRFRLPDSLTTYRLMAVATTTDDRYGYAERRVTSSKPLMARPALPRLFRAGDHAEAGLIVSAKEFGPARVEITMKVQGLGAQPTEEHRTVELPRNGSTEVRFPLAAALVGTARFEFDTRASSAAGPAQDKVIVERRVASPAQLEAVAMYGETQAAVAEKLGDLSSIRRDVGSLELRATSSALVGLD
ncbi:MAG TPA: MG2 domain-containing protein, partial [Polyangiaceae bacterium]|nr:MG2 domain-containing protein [Polyangiaceae bacterium]